MSDIVSDIIAPKSHVHLNVGLYFGTYNPIHIGHLAIANYMVEFTPIDQLWFVVSPHNPHKQKTNLLDDYQRLEMVHRAVEGDDRFRVSNIEFHLPKPSYTIHTLIQLQEQYPKHHFNIIMGSDNLASFDKWKNYEQILENYGIIVYPRPGFEPAKMPIHKNIMHASKAPRMEISSSFIRKSIREGKDVRHFLPPKTWQYIEEMHFYKK